MLREVALIGVVSLLVLQQALPQVTAAFAQEEGDPAMSPSAALGSAITYQGRLVQDGEDVSGTRDFEFELFDAPAGGASLGTISRPNLAVIGGIFSTELSFPGTPFAGDARWLEVRVKPAGSGSFETLGRQQLTATPYAFYAKATNWVGVANKPAGFADNIDNDLLATLTDCQFGQAPRYTGGSFACGPDSNTHDHFGQTWVGAAPDGLKVIDTGASANAIAGYGTGGNSIGVFGDGLRTGVWGSSSNVGVFGISQNVGVLGNGSGSGPAVQGYNFGTDPAASIGVWGETDNGLAAVYGKNSDATASAASAGVIGQGNNAIGVRGFSNSNVGVQGESIGLGVYGQGAIGVRGFSNKPDGFGAMGITYSAGGVGTYGYAEGTSGIGVKGIAAGSAPWAGFFQGNVIVNGVFVNNSDIRLKKDIEPLHYGLADILKLQPKSYVYREGDGSTQLGLIAQDVREVVPELIVADPTNAGMLSVNYIGLIPVLIQAIQEQQAQIVALTGALAAR
ncbi:hypothetical protein AYO38_09995 [bacterium SCGC AG-212-C10]|nr:hypothetical protein AYO38_09995 [bacterium SCGC AG-212-C10]